MALDALIAQLESEKVTPVTRSKNHVLPLEPAPRLAVTPVTPVTPGILHSCKKTQTTTDAPPTVTVIAETSVGRVMVEMEVPRALPDNFRPVKGVAVHYGLADGRSLKLIDPSGMESAVHCLCRTYGNRLQTIDGRPAATVIREVLGEQL